VSIHTAARRHPLRPQTLVARGLLYIVLIIGVLATILPFIWMLLGSVKPREEIVQTPPTWLPQNFTWGNFVQLFTQLDFPQFFFNSFVVALFVTLGNLVFCSMVGYALAKMDFPGKRLVFGGVLMMLMVPGIVTFIPLFVLVARMGLVNTYPGMILPFLVTPIGVFLMRQFIADLPDEIIEAGRLDGAGELRIFARLIMPLTGPALATLTILTFLSSWNNFLWPLVVAQTQDKYTLPVALAVYANSPNGNNYGLILAGAVMVILPVLLIFIALQRFFTQGIAATGIK
jgi:multiple sugar transport system permease protein